MGSKRVVRSLIKRPKQPPASQRATHLSALTEPLPAATTQLNADRWFTTLFDLSLEAIVLLDRQGHCIAANPAAGELFDCPPPTLIGQPWTQWLPPTEPRALDWLLGQPSADGTWRFRRSDGSERVVTYRLKLDFAPECALLLLRDVTERHQLQHELALHQKYQTLFDILPIGVCITDQQGQIVEANPASEQILGMPIAEQTSRTDDAATWQIVRPDGTPMPAAEFPSVKALRENRVIAGQEQGIVQPDGSLHWIRVSAAPIPLADYGVAIAYVDITAHKQTELALAESNAYYQSLTQAMPLALFRKDCEGRLTFLNQACLDTVGRPFTEVLGKTVYDFYPPELAQQYDADDRQVLETGMTLQRIEAHQSSQQAARTYVQVVKSPVRDEAGTIIGTQGIFWDITDRITLETALRESEATNQAVLEAIPDLLLKMHRDGTYLQVHKSSGVHLINSDRLQVGNNIWDILPEAMVVERMGYIQQALDTNRLQVYEYEFTLAGETFYEEARIVPLSQDEVLLLVRDITQRKGAELALRQREQEFRTLAEHSPDGILRLDRQFRFLYVNPVIAAQTGLAAADFLGQTATELGFPEPLVQTWQAAIARVWETGTRQEIETQEFLQTGLSTLASRIVPELSPAGAIESVLIVSRDITALKQAQDELWHQSQRERLFSMITQQLRQSLDLAEVLTTAVAQMRSLLQADRTLIYRFHPDGSGDMIAESVVAPWRAVLGSNVHDPCFTGDLVTLYQQGKVHQIEDLATTNCEACYQDLLTGFQVRANLVVPIVDGELLWGLFCIHHCATPHRWQDWEIDALQRLVDQLAIAIQQSELYQQVRQLNVRLEQQVQTRTAALQQSLEFERVLKRITDRVRDSLDETEILEAVIQELAAALDLEFCDTGIYNADRTISTIVHEYTRVSQPTAKGLTFAIADAIGRDVYPTLFRGEPIQFANCQPFALRQTHDHLTVLACPIWEGQTLLGDLWLFRPPTKIFTELEVRLVQQVANQCAIALRQSRLYRAAENQVVALERLNQLKDDFLSTVSHELRTPMSNIKMATELLEIYLTQQHILSPDFGSLPLLPNAPAIERYFQILKDEGKREINLINDLLDLARIDAHTEPLLLTDLDLKTWIPHQIEAFVTRTQQQQQSLILRLPARLPPFTTDAAHLQRILHELLNNACKYTPAGATIRIVARAIAAQNLLELKIANSGVHIAAVECDRIFDRFYRIPNNDPWKHGGTGLGLALVKKLVEYLQGTIWAESKANQLQFVIRLPLQPQVESSPPA